MDRLGNLTQNAQLVLQSNKTDSKVSFHMKYEGMTYHSIWDDNFQRKILKAVSDNVWKVNQILLLIIIIAPCRRNIKQYAYPSYSNLHICLISPYETYIIFLILHVRKVRLRKIK